MACFVTAVFGWGFGLYGQAVYVADLQATRGWSATLVSSASTLYYLVGAVLLTCTPRAVTRLGPRAVLIGGAAVMGAGASVVANAAAPWQLFAGSVVMALGWACTSTTAIATTLALWFDHQRGLAISLALNGASAGGFTVAPVLVGLGQAVGLPAAVPAVALGLFLLQAPIVLLGMARPRRSLPATLPRLDAADARPVLATRAEALRDARFWHVAAPFALALMAQVAILVHLVAVMVPRVGPKGAAVALALVSVMAVLGRIGLGLTIDRLDQRRVSAASFASQAAAILLLLALPDVPAAQYAGCIGFGLSVGNVITLPSLIVQREFAAASFGLLVGLSTAVGQVAYAFAPSLAGVVHDAAGGYGPALLLCVALQVAASVLVLPRRRRFTA
nr:MFS transporter [Limobrevibacterium gyesilva]